MSRLRALLATLRIANAPSVVSNVWLGYMVGWMVWSYPFWHRFDSSGWQSLGILSTAGLCLYFAGNLANDWFDRNWDSLRRPERALPSGLFPPTTYLTGAVVLSLAGVGIAATESLASAICAIVILALIGVYTCFHKKAIWAVVPMGLCRACLYAMGFFASWQIWDPQDHPYVGLDVTEMIVTKLMIITTLMTGLFCYIVGLSLSARYEGMEHPPLGPLVVSKALLILPLLAMSCWFMPQSPLFGIMGMIPFLIWLILCLTRFRAPIPRYVSALLAGIPLVDFIAAAPIALYADSDLIEQSLWDLPHLLALFLIPLAAFVLGRLLQKVAPAT
jgi:4-hydroxybenzoate polyprenyltransferase